MLTAGCGSKEEEEGNFVEYCLSERGPLVFPHFLSFVYRMSSRARITAQILIQTFQLLAL